MTRQSFLFTIQLPDPADFSPGHRIWAARMQQPDPTPAVLLSLYKAPAGPDVLGAICHRWQIRSLWTECIPHGSEVEVTVLDPAGRAIIRNMPPWGEIPF